MDLRYIVLGLSLLSSSAALQKVIPTEQAHPAPAPAPATSSDQDSSEEDEVRKLDLPIEQWLREGERREIKAKTEIYGPYLTFQQRYLVRLNEKVDIHGLQKRAKDRDLHSIIKIADSDGRWIAEESYAHIQFDEKVPKNTDLELSIEVHLTPGRYTLASIIYDHRHHERNVTLKRVEVKDESGGVLPDLGRTLPKVEFLPRRQRFTAQLGEGKISLPVQTLHPVNVDVVFDVGAPWLTGQTRLGQYVASQQVVAANVISQITPEGGCLRVSAIDVLRQEVLFGRVDARRLDWMQRRAAVLGRNLHTIEVTKINKKSDAAKFFRDAMQVILDTTPGCPAANETPKRLVVVVTSGVLFPPGTPVPSVEPSAACKCDVVYLKMGRMGLFDDLTKVLKPLRPLRIEAEDPREFRKQLQWLADEIRRVGS